VKLTIDHAPEQVEPVSDAGFGALRTDRGNLPLRAMDVRAQITAMIAGVEIVQDFANPFDVPLEATYVFPLPDRGAVTALRMQADGRVIEGALAERAQARLDYEAAIEAGKRAAIAEEDRPDVFTMRVGNILPGEEVTITLAMTQPLPYDDGDITFRFPLVVAPRYIPGSALPGVPTGTGVATDTDAVPDASRISPPVLLPGFPNPVRLGVTADIDPAGLALRGIRSSLHAVTQESAEDGHVIVRLAPGERLNRDLIIRLAVADPASVVGSLVVCPDQPGPASEPEAADGAAAGLGTGTFMLTLVPPSLAPTGPPRDVVILLDRSGSMGGWKMVAARRAAARIIDTLATEDRFAVLCFDNEVVQPPEQANMLVAGTDRNRFRAVEFLAGMSARGGTEMLRALELAAGLLSGVVSEGTGQESTGQESTGQESTGQEGTDRQRVLVLVTDGQVGNEDQILRALSPRLKGARVHVVGIDQAVNAGFLTRLAATGRGRCELVESQDRLDEAMAGIHERIASPVVTGLRLEASGLRIVADSTAPARLPDLFAGAPALICGRFDTDDPASASITVRGVSADGSRYEQVLTGISGRSGATSATWARGFLRELEDRYTCLATGSPGELEHLENQIVALSLRFGVLCRFTAFLAVDSRVVTEGGTPHRVTQPVELPAGWEMSAGWEMPASTLLAGHAAASVSLTSAPPAPPGLPAPPARPARPARPAPPMAPMAPAPPAAPVASGYNAFARQGAPPLAKAAGRWPGMPRRSPARPATRSGPATGSGPAGGPTLPQWAIEQIKTELGWLDATPDARAFDLSRDLADLGSRLAALLKSLSGDGVEPRRLTGLRELVAKLQPGQDGRIRPADAAELRERARTVLRELLDDRRSRAPFWKRPTS
jgi:Ca-activated chloride channel family protein